MGTVVKLRGNVLLHPTALHEKGIAVLVNSSSPSEDIIYKPHNTDDGNRGVGPVDFFGGGRGGDGGCGGNDDSCGGVCDEQQRTHHQRGDVFIHPPRHSHAVIIPLGVQQQQPITTTNVSQNTTIFNPRFCQHLSMVPNGQYCSPDCDKCPKWGAKECLFGRRPYNIISCDLCPKYAKPGCLFHSDDNTTATILPSSATATPNAASDAQPILGDGSGGGGASSSSRKC